MEPTVPKQKNIGPHHIKRLNKCTKKINNSNSKQKMLENLKDTDSPEGFARQLNVSGRSIDIFAPQLVNLFPLPPLNQATNATKQLVENARAARKTAQENTTPTNPNLSEKIKWSEELAERRADQVMEAKGITENGSPYQKLDPDNPPGTLPGKQGQFDRIYEGHDGTIYVVECKGGASTLGGRMVNDNGTTKVAQQGSKKYRDSIIDNLIDKLGADNAIVDKILDARLMGKLKYVYIKQPVTNLDNLVNPVVKQFDIQ